VIFTRSHREVRELLDGHRAAGRSVGLVGTSGAVHEGHLSLVERARRETDVVAVFWTGGLNLDWAPASAQVYDRDVDRDAALLAAAGADVFLLMVRDDVYPVRPVTSVEMPALGPNLDGMPEGNHMSLLLTTVLTLLNIAGPCTNYYGEKDWQQLVLFQRMANDLLLPSRIVGCPTVREPDGVARSSRNVRLTPAERADAPAIHRALTEAVELVRAGERDAGAVTGLILDRLREVAVPDYAVAVEADSLRRLDVLEGEVRLLVSATFGATPLVDNIGVRVPATATAAAAAATEAEAATGTEATTGGGSAGENALLGGEPAK
jgi:pantoate--beta-alanine ligase